MNGKTIVPDLLIRVAAASIQIFLGIFFNPPYGFFKKTRLLVKEFLTFDPVINNYKCHLPEDRNLILNYTDFRFCGNGNTAKISMTLNISIKKS